mmetsp:Transcript_3423/g.10391  ORF Transcript_3423/g.10391 Transcript_3423/m.10391 type:complete len:152 (+) Transcript_3423:258-713(+)
MPPAAGSHPWLRMCTGRKSLGASNFKLHITTFTTSVHLLVEGVEEARDRTLHVLGILRNVALSLEFLGSKWPTTELRLRSKFTDRPYRPWTTCVKANGPTGADPFSICLVVGVYAWLRDGWRLAQKVDKESDEWVELRRSGKIGPRGSVGK